MRRGTAAVLLSLLVIVAPARAQGKKCPPDSVPVGSVCIDTFEASVWQIPPSNKGLVKKVQSGKVTPADLTKGGAVQLGCDFSPFNLTIYPANFPNSGQWTPVLGSVPPSPGVYAASLPGVTPSSCITWFQAAQACVLSGKHLPTNLEWQNATVGTPDPGTDNGTTDCNVSTGVPASTGSRSSCKSVWGVFDMVGNAEEWVADWGDRPNAGCSDSTTQFGFAGTGDAVCIGGSGSIPAPGALVRGGTWDDAGAAGVFDVRTDFSPAGASNRVGFRCAR
jgi:formylglycine-generating enzyme required for sulfatase activity